MEHYSIDGKPEIVYLNETKLTNGDFEINIYDVWLKDRGRKGRGSNDFGVILSENSNGGMRAKESRSDECNIEKKKMVTLSR